MKYWRLNTDSAARDDAKTCDLWYKMGKAFAGDYRENMGKHESIFRKLSPGDGIFMHHSDTGIVGFGIVTAPWDQQTYERDGRQLYRKETYEYRIEVDWADDCDCRENPLSISGRLPYMGTYSHVDQKKGDAVLHDLKNQTSINRILSCIGKKVSFKYPGNEGDKHGILKDRAVIESANEPGAVPYWDVVDLIEFKNEREPTWLRIGYYRKPKNSLNWGSQTTITEPISVWKNILVSAAREKKWFQVLLEDVMNELKQPDKIGL